MCQSLRSAHDAVRFTSTMVVTLVLISGSEGNTLRSNWTPTGAKVWGTISLAESGRLLYHPRSTNRHIIFSSWNTLVWVELLKVQKEALRRLLAV